MELQRGAGQQAQGWDFTFAVVSDFPCPLQPPLSFLLSLILSLPALLAPPHSPAGTALVTAPGNHDKSVF